MLTMKTIRSMGNAAGRVPLGKREARRLVRWLAPDGDPQQVQALMHKGLSALSGEALELIAEFRMPDRRWRDADNLLAMIKSGIDGVCDATGINDRAFRRVTVDRVMDGAGIVRLTIRESNALGQGSAACGASPAPTSCAANSTTNDERTEK